MRMTWTKLQISFSTPNFHLPQSQMKLSNSTTCKKLRATSPNAKSPRPLKSQWTSNKRKRKSNNVKWKTSKTSGKKPLKLDKWDQCSHRISAPPSTMTWFEEPPMTPTGIRLSCPRIIRPRSQGIWRPRGSAAAEILELGLGCRR